MYALYVKEVAKYGLVLLEELNVEENPVSKLRAEGEMMIERLKYLIDECEDKPKLKSMLLRIASLKEENQESAIALLEILVKARVEK
jgi:hypothetical protein